MRRLKQLEAENARLKKLVAEQSAIFQETSSTTFAKHSSATEARCPTDGVVDVIGVGIAGAGVEQDAHRHD